MKFYFILIESNLAQFEPEYMNLGTPCTDVPMQMKRAQKRKEWKIITQPETGMVWTQKRIGTSFIRKN